jgi:hypothetical protein
VQCVSDSDRTAAALISSSPLDCPLLLLLSARWRRSTVTARPPGTSSSFRRPPQLDSSAASPPSQRLTLVLCRVLVAGVANAIPLPLVAFDAGNLPTIGASATATEVVSASHRRNMVSIDESIWHSRGSLAVTVASADVADVRRPPTTTGLDLAASVRVSPVPVVPLGVLMSSEVHLADADRNSSQRTGFPSVGQFHVCA